MRTIINRWLVACIERRQVIKLFKILVLSSALGMTHQEHVYAKSIGVMLHYLPETVSIEAIQSSVYIDTIMRMKEINVGHVIITIGQNDGEYWLRSNQLSEKCNGYRDQKLEKAEYIERIINEFQGAGISVFFYLPFRAPQNNKKLMNCLHDEGEKNEPSRYFLAAWSEVVKEWRVKYENIISGWWIDGVYKTKSIQKSDWIYICDAFAGENNKLLVAFNPGEGVEKLGQKIAPCQNMDAGEINDIRFAKRNSKVINKTMTPHILTFVTQHWGRDGVIKYTIKDMKKLCDIDHPKTMLTLDLPIEKNFEIKKEYMYWLEKVMEVCDEKVH